MQHFFVDQDISGDHLVVSDPELLHQFRNVLRFEKGDKCVFLDGKGGKTIGVMETSDKKVIIFGLAEYRIFDGQKRKITVYIAIPKKPAIFELILQKATELGVTDIVPLLTPRCQTREIRNGKRLLAIIKESAEQCERLFLPNLHPVLKWEKFIENTPSGKILTGDARVDAKKLCDLQFLASENLNLVIGPEGGLTEKELQDVIGIGGQIFTLGEMVLRMETAVIAALSLIVCR